MKDSYVNRAIEIKAFYPNYNKKVRSEVAWRSLCPVRALRIYLDKSSEIRDSSSTQLFVAYGKLRKGKPVCKNTIAKWLTETVSHAYKHFDRPIPEGIKAHSTRSVSTSMAALNGVSISEICKAATWSSSYIFAKHYRLDVVSSQKSKFSSAVLGSHSSER